MNTEELIIKKYPNRRLYDTSRGVYITLEDIKKFVLEQKNFRVIDARTQKDLTQTTLLQIISEQENSAQTPLFSIKILQDFIRFYHEKSQDSFSQYLENALNLFTQQSDFLQKQWDTYQQFLKNPAQKKPKKSARKKASK